MISEDTLKQIQVKTTEFLSNAAQKIWEHKFALIPIAILGYGFIKNGVSLKVVVTKPSLEIEVNLKNSSDEASEANETTETNETVLLSDRRKYKRRIHVPSMHLQAKLSRSASFKEEILMSEVALTPRKFVKDTGYVKTPLTEKVTTDSTHSGYHSDVESVIQDTDNMAKKRSELAKTENPDDLFFTIYQQLK